MAASSRTKLRRYTISIREFSRAKISNANRLFCSDKSSAPNNRTLLLSAKIRPGTIIRENSSKACRVVRISDQRGNRAGLEPSNAMARQSTTKPSATKGLVTEGSWLGVRPDLVKLPDRDSNQADGPQKWRHDLNVRPLRPGCKSAHPLAPTNCRVRIEWVLTVASDVALTPPMPS
ncbi:hypothetical protein UC8_01430 [Roseimaritima ulvae]|uniref:Uncharacterized protein n=1 Tax=Roseimaritima ulvae TaxID=980254 RepID=A0A5B9QKR9_9BACT|nr:hypothetical protein UC8_01430 [Roseimaritima ulvae]